MTDYITEYYEVIDNMDICIGLVLVMSEQLKGIF